MSTVSYVSFGRYRLSNSSGPLFCGDDEISLRRKSMAVLWHLVSHPGEVVSKEQLLEVVWPRKVISDSGLTVCIREIRKALNDDSRSPQYIKTVPGHGYRFIAKVTSTVSSDLALPSRASSVRELVVGREHNLEQLDSAFNQSAGGYRQLLFLSGEAGIGKTTLINAWESGLEEYPGLRRSRGQCIENGGTGEAYLPLLEALSELCASASGVEVVSMLSQYAPSWLLQLPAQISDKDREELKLRQQNTNTERMQRELADVLEVLSTEKPLVLVLEDMHWCDPSTVEALAMLARRPQSAKLLIIASYRPVDLIVQGHPLKAAKQELQFHDKCQDIALGYLKKDDVAVYLNTRFGVALTSDLIEEIHHRTEGHPMFMVTLARFLASSGELPSDRDCRVALQNMELPAGLQDFIRLQITRLTENENQILEAACVAGRSFDVTLVATALNVSEEAVEEVCESLHRRELFINDNGLTAWPDGSLSGRYRFKHAMYQESLYEGIGSARRAKLHRAIGKRLEQGFVDKTQSIESTLAQHFERGHEPQQALQYLQLAAETAQSRFADQEVVQLLRRALVQLDAWTAAENRESIELTLQLILGPALVALEGYASPAVKETFDRARTLCQTLGNTPSQFPVMRGLATYYVMRADYNTAFDVSQNLLAMAQSNEPLDTGQTMESHLMLGTTQYFSGDFTSARVNLKIGTDLYDLEQHRSHALHFGYDSGVLGLCMTSVCCWSLGDTDQAMVKCDESMAHAETAAHPYSTTQCRNIAAYLHLLNGDVTQTRKYAEETITLSEQYDFSYLAAGAWVYLGWAVAHQGDHQKGLEHIQSGLDLYQASGAKGALTTLYATHAEVCALNNEISTGLSVVAAALGMVTETGEGFCAAELHRLNGELLQLESETDSVPRAESSFQQALVLARRQNAKSWELRAATSLAKLWIELGRKAEAYELLEPICSWFAEGFSNTDFKQARQLLDDLSETLLEVHNPESR